MKHGYYVKRLKEYDESNAQELKIAIERTDKLRSTLRKRPTSVALDEATILALKELAQWRGVPYQVLMRNFIVEGLRRSLAEAVRDRR